MKGTILFIGLGALLGFLLLQRLFAWKQRATQLGLKADTRETVYLFTAPNCAVCVRMKTAHGDALAACRITVVDITRDRDLTARYHIRSVPTTLVVRTGVVVQVFHGFVPPALLAPWLSHDLEGGRP